MLLVFPLHWKTPYTPPLLAAVVTVAALVVAMAESRCYTGSLDRHGQHTVHPDYQPECTSGPHAAGIDGNTCIKQLLPGMAS